jgi:hypothetical protein
MLKKCLSFGLSSRLMVTPQTHGGNTRASRKKEGAMAAYRHAYGHNAKTTAEICGFAEKGG